MGIILSRQTEMTAAHRHILGLPHRAKSQTANQRLLFASFYFFQKLLNLLGMNLPLLGTDGITKVINK